MNFSIAWSDGASQEVNLYRDGDYYATIAAGVEVKLIGVMYGDGTHDWKAQHIDPEGEFSSTITTIDGVVGGGGGPSGAPSNLSVYEYGGGAKFGIQWDNGDETANTSLERDGVEEAFVAWGESVADIGLKAGDGEATWRARHWQNGVYSTYSATIDTVGGVEA